MSYNILLALIVNGSALFFEGTDSNGQPVFTSSRESARRYTRDEASALRRVVPALAVIRAE